MSSYRFFEAQWMPPRQFACLCLDSRRRTKIICEMKRDKFRMSGPPKLVSFHFTHGFFILLGLQRCKTFSACTVSSSLYRICVIKLVHLGLRCTIDGSFFAHIKTFFNYGARKVLVLQYHYSLHDRVTLCAYIPYRTANH